MKVSNSISPNTIKATDQPFEIKKGDIYSATIKERLPHNEAVVQIRGKDVHVKFEGKIPQQDQVMIQVKGSEDGRIPYVHTVASNSPKASADVELQQIFRTLGVQDSPQLKQMVQMLIDRGQPFSKDTIEQLRVFLEKSFGTVQQKFETVQAIANKGLDVTTLHLQSVHEALHGKSLSASLKDIEHLLVVNRSNGQDVSGPSTANFTSNTHSVIGNSIRALLLEGMQFMQNGAKLDDALTWIQQRLLSHASLSQEEMQSLTKAFQESVQLQQKGHTEYARQWIYQALHRAYQSRSATSNLDVLQHVTHAQQQLRNGGDLQQAIGYIRQQVVPQLPEQLQIEIARQLQEVERFANSQQERRAIASFSSLADRLETTLPIQDQVNNQMDDLIARAELGMLNDTLNREGNLLPIFTTLEPSSKQFIVTEVTRHMSQLAIDFKAHKREILRNVDNIMNTIHVAKAQSYAQVKTLLESTIDKLDRAILKNEILLYSDMKTEKQLLVISSQLADARKYLAKGDHLHALQILQSVKDSLSQIHIRPENVKIRHLLLQEAMNHGQPMVYTPDQNELQQLAERMYPADRSGRSMYEAFRALGLNYDSEIAQSLTNRSSLHQEQLQNNVKAILIKLTQGEELSQQQRTTVEQIVNNITGQQLLSKTDTGSNLQTMFFNLPYLMNGEQGDLKLYINGKKEGEKIDWENCNLYFLIETKNLGDLGVLISATDRNLSITIKNDQPNLKNRMEGIIEHHKEQINEIGYNVSSIQFTQLHGNENKSISTEVETKPIEPKTISSPTMNMRGFDSRI